MNQIFFFSSLIVIFVGLTFVPYTIAAEKEKKTNPIKFIVKEDYQSGNSIKKIINKLNEVAKGIENSAKAYNTLGQQAYWENKAKHSFLKYLASQGYYGANIETEILKKNNTIIFRVIGGERYKIKRISLNYLENSNLSIKAPSLKEIEIKEGDFAVADDVINMQNYIAEYLEKNNCLLNLEVTHQAIINHLDATISVDFMVYAGPSANIKSVEFHGLTSVNSSYVKKLISIKKGQCFQPSLLNEVQSNLQKSNLFAVVAPRIPDQIDENGEVPIIFDVKEKKHRSLKLGVNYGSTLGLGVRAGWNHRNFSGSGELVKTQIFTNRKEQVIDLTYSKPFFREKNQTLKIGFSGEKRNSRAFNEKQGALFSGVEKQLKNMWVAGISGKYSYSVVKNNKSIKDYSFLSTPSFITRDTRDNFFNPTKGYELQFKTEPFFPVRGEGNSFLKSELIFSKIFSFKTKFDPIIATKISIGSISGVKSLKAPANEKFYVGGGNSVRGYGYQLAENLDSNNCPLGGRSMFATNIEFRAKIKNNIGLVLFTDAGKAYSSISPKFNQEMFYGYGFGIRYFAGFGPLRMDIGFPLKRRKKIDKSFQLYFGIGQNF